MEIIECNRIGHHRHSFVHGKRKMNVMLLFASRDILKYDRFFNFCGKKDQKRFSHGAQVKKPTLPKRSKLTRKLTILFHEQILTWLPPLLFISA